MKKIMLFFLLLFSFINIIYAETISYSDFNYSINIDNENYIIYPAMYGNKYIYFLNKSHDYNLNGDDYYETSFENSPYDESIIELLSSRLHANIDDYYDRYIFVIYKVLWESIYNQEVQYDVLDEYEQQLKDKYLERINNLKNGPDFCTEINYQNIFEEKEYEINYLNYYDIIDENELIKEINDNKMIIESDNEGEYQIVFKRKRYGLNTEAKLYTDGTNYFVTDSEVTNKEYIMNIKVIDPSKEIVYPIIEPVLPVINNDYIESKKIDVSNEENNVISKEIKRHEVLTNLENISSEIIFNEDISNEITFDDDYQDEEVTLNEIKDIKTKYKVINERKKEYKNVIIFASLLLLFIIIGLRIIYILTK